MALVLTGSESYAPDVGADEVSLDRASEVVALFLMRAVCSRSIRRPYVTCTTSYIVDNKEGGRAEAVYSGGRLIGVALARHAWRMMSSTIRDVAILGSSCRCNCRKLLSLQGSNMNILV